jgi:DNA-directed RNA polymerase IV subunit 1
MMKKKRLGLGFVVEELTKEYDATRNQLNNEIPSVRISKM